MTRVVRSRADRGWPADDDLAKLLRPVFDNRHVQVYQVAP